MRKKRLTKRIVCLLLGTVLLLSGTALAAFSDTSGNWAESAIQKWSGQYGIIQGYSDGTFRPDKTITRGAFAAILVRLMQYQTTSPAETFSDTPGSWCETEVLRLNAAGVYLGDSGRANILSKISRQQAVAMIGRAFGITESTADLNYSDASSVMPYARGYVAAMSEKGYLSDTPAGGNFRPAEPITRAEVVNILNNMVDSLIQQPGIYSSGINGTLMLNTSGVTLKGCTITGDLVIGPGVSGTVTLQDVTLNGSIRNLGGAEVKRITTPVPTAPGTTQYITYGSSKIPVLTDVEKSILTAGNFYWGANNRLVCTSDQFTTQFGIDVSANQNRSTPGGVIDWNAVANDGVQFALVRVGGRGTSASGNLYPDAYYAQNLDGAIASGITTGAYFFSQATTVEEAVEEADYVISLLNGREITGPVAYDWEMKDSTYRVYGTSKETATACALAFCQRIAEAGYQPMIYASKYVGYFKFDLSQLKQYPIWYPAYKYTTSSNVYPDFYYQVDYWQYNNKTQISGIGGNVDASLRFIKK